ncbi:hypothetical protein LXA28_18450, partial [Erwinia amylovora]|nr:hypothetical protein [Erwinia amylovora]
LSRLCVTFRPYYDLRRGVNLCIRYIVHEWSTSCVTVIPGYSTYVVNAAKAALFLNYGGYIGIGFAFAGTTKDVADACTKVREGECG